MRSVRQFNACHLPHASARRCKSGHTRSPTPFAHPETLTTPSALLGELRAWSALNSNSQHSARGRNRGRCADAQPPALPLSLAADAHLVAVGRKALLVEDDAFRFACTGCGACCRSFADTVLLDPQDLWRMRNASAISLDSLEHFRHAIGRFTLAALPPGWTLEELLHDRTGLAQLARDGDIKEAAAAIAFLAALRNRLAASDANDGMLPVVFLRSTPTMSNGAAVASDGPDKQRRQRTMRRLSPERARRRDAVEDETTVPGSRWDLHLRCTFAAPAVPAATHNADNASSSGAGTLTSASRLVCTLGRVAMPTACALYPLGDLWSVPSRVSTESTLRPPPSPMDADNSVGTAELDVETMRMYFYSLDTARCEGIEADGASAHDDGELADGRSNGGRSSDGIEHDNSRASDMQGAHRPLPKVPIRSVRQYRKDNALLERRVAGEWFTALATATAIIAPDQAAAMAVERLLGAAAEAAVEAALQAAAGNLSVSEDAVAAIARAVPHRSSTYATSECHEHPIDGTWSSDSSSTLWEGENPLGNVVATAVQRRLAAALYDHASGSDPQAAPLTWEAARCIVERRVVVAVAEAAEATGAAVKAAERLESWVLLLRRQRALHDAAASSAAGSPVLHRQHNGTLLFSARQQVAATVRGIELWVAEVFGLNPYLR